MEQITNQNESKAVTERAFLEPRIYLSKDGEYLLHFLPGNIIVRKHVNLYKKILGIPFEPKAPMKYLA